jgi:hypothetical protein
MEEESKIICGLSQQLVLAWEEYLIESRDHLAINEELSSTSLSKALTLLVHF